ncbi:MAG TPA: hypothetical protein VFE25_16620, partial [Opitutaceae bacterium]|nr:hypothetical protein [Opitutaceae bacterium]
MIYSNRIVSAAFLAAVATSVASAKIDREVEKTFVVQPGMHLKVSTLGGNVTVHSSGDTKVTIVAKEHIHADNDVEADDMLKKLELTMEQSGNDITASASYEHSIGMHW